MAIRRSTQLAYLSGASLFFHGMLEVSKQEAGNDYHGEDNNFLRFLFQATKAAPVLGGILAVATVYVAYCEIKQIRALHKTLHSAGQYRVVGESDRTDLAVITEGKVPHTKAVADVWANAVIAGFTGALTMWVLYPLIHGLTANPSARSPGEAPSTQTLTPMAGAAIAVSVVAGSFLACCLCFAFTRSKAAYAVNVKQGDNETVNNEPIKHLCSPC